MYSCKVSENSVEIQDSGPVQEIVQDSTELTLEEKIEVRLYKGERTRHFRLLHTKLELSFDWGKQWVFGKALLIAEPYFYEQSSIIVDAKGFEIHDITMLNGLDTSKLNYEYDGQKINIDLGRSYKKGQKVHLNISYTAKINEALARGEMSNNERGIYFINPRGDDQQKPQQLWTHGETDANSRWFPTLDAPNQKSTQEIFITVNERFRTLSNGTLIYSKSNSDGTRTDYWSMDQPHAPYLFMMAVGEFAVVEDDWNGKTVDYYIEPAYEPFARDIFGNTPEMMTYFSEVLGYPFPWNKYSQVIVRDFVSGAMENTSASVFMEDLNVDSRELLDYNWDDIIAHELFHQWFGNLVTCESWANLPLNESFATYGEYLWTHHKYGADEAEYHLYAELENYLNEAENKQEDLIRYYYREDDEMFDNHSYAKGGLILHMLRDYLGDEAFFQSLKYYLKSHEFGKTEVHDLRLAFEHISGEDLNWFFNQWFLAAGHPKLKIEEVYENDVFIVKVWQEQDIDAYPVYKLPLTLDLWEDGRKTQYLIEVDKPYQEFEFGDVSSTELVLVDSEYMLVGEKQHTKSPRQLQYQFSNYDGNVRARLEALEYFLQSPHDSISKIVIAEALTDPFWAIREEALFVFENDSTDFFLDHENVIKDMARKDPNPLVKAGAISVLASKERSAYLDIFRSQLNDSSYSVVGQALYAYLQSKSSAEDVESELLVFEDETNFSITSALADYYIQNNDYGKYDWFVDKILTYSGSDLWYFTKLFGMYLISAPEEQIQSGIKELEYIARNHSQFYNRLSAYQSLELFADVEGVSKTLESIKRNERDDRLKEYYDQ
ncbi:MAG: M1 family metallopeptidase [Cytophagales bacterium]|nr:M1 family metallopeptidase [Cytophagales bacterium]